MTPIVSIVMGVYNGADSLSVTMDSVLNQTLQEFELIAVDDGSSDPEVLRILEKYAAEDARVKPVRLEQNGGLTRALIAGCALAQGTYLARIDAGDRYRAEKLEKQVAFIGDHPGVALLSCATRFSTEEGDLLYDEIRTDSMEEATASLRANTLEELRGVTAHGAVLMRRADYIAAGGYRPEFYFAQDMDLWMRLSDHGSLAFMPDILFDVCFEASGISGLYNKQQVILGDLIIKMRRCREAGQPEDELLRRAKLIRPGQQAEGVMIRRNRRARSERFIGSVLAQRGNKKARKYFWAALKLNPFHPATWKHLMLSFMRSYS
jgi:glycosyltransferase involved in cell wall biosynthesis